MLTNESYSSNIGSGLFKSLVAVEYFWKTVLFRNFFVLKNLDTAGKISIKPTQIAPFMTTSK